MRRYAILDDNQQLLEQRLADLARELPAHVESRVCAACVIGSVAEGRARDASDIDLVLVLRSGTPRRSDYEWWASAGQPSLSVPGRFPLQPVFIARESVATAEPNLRHALSHGIRLWDPEGILRDEPEARA